MTSSPKPGAEGTRLWLRYDAWNRLTHVSANSDHNPTIAEYRYDGLHRRISKAITGGDTFHYYYNENWQVLEVTKGSAAYEQYVWDARYIDAPVLRWRDANNSEVDGLEETLFYTNDANMNVTALVNESGLVVERYRYDAYGKVTFLAGTKDLAGQPTTEWTVRNASIADNQVLYCGYRFDPETGLYQVRYRMLHPTAGRWMQRDPIGYVDGTTLYEYVSGSPLNACDPTGRAWVTKLFHADGVGMEFASFSIGGPFYLPPVTWSVSGGFQYLYDCRNGGEGLFAFIGAGLGLGTPGPSFSSNFGAFWVWGLSYGVSSYKQDFITVTGSAVYGLGLYGEAFISPSSVYRHLKDPANEEIVGGFGLGKVTGLPSAGITAQYQWSWLLHARANVALRRTFCCDVGSRNGPPTAERVLQHSGDAPRKELRDAARTISTDIALSRVILHETMKRAQGTRGSSGGITARAILRRAISAYPQGVDVGYY